MDSVLKLPAIQASEILKIHWIPWIKKNRLHLWKIYCKAAPLSADCPQTLFSAQLSEVALVCDLLTIEYYMSWTYKYSHTGFLWDYSEI